MQLRITLLSWIVVICSFPLVAQNDGTRSVSLFMSGIRMDRTADGFSSQPFREVHSWEGALGVALEHRVAPLTTVELSAEYRRDVASSVFASRCNQNTCFRTARFEIMSTPVVVLVRRAAPAIGRLTFFGSVGARYVAKPSAQSLSPHPMLSFNTSQRISVEAGAGITWRATHSASFFAEGRFLTRAGVQWDPGQRLNLGMRIRY